MASEDQGEQEILQIASEVSDVADIVVPRKLVKLQSKSLKRQLWVSVTHLLCLLVLL